jgi:hypothetical protein
LRLVPCFYSNLKWKSTKTERAEEMRLRRPRDNANRGNRARGLQELASIQLFVLVGSVISQSVRKNVSILVRALQNRNCLPGYAKRQAQHGSRRVFDAKYLLWYKLLCL